MKITYILHGRECSVIVYAPAIASTIAMLKRTKATNIVKVK